MSAQRFTDAQIVRQAAWDVKCVSGYQQVSATGFVDPLKPFEPWHSADCPRHRLLAIADRLEASAPGTGAPKPGIEGAGSGVGSDGGQ